MAHLWLYLLALKLKTLNQERLEKKNVFQFVAKLLFKIQPEAACEKTGVTFT